MRPKLTFLEALYLVIGSLVLGNEIFRTQTLTVAELGLVLFFFGLTAASVADREGGKGPVEVIRALTDLFRGRSNP
jgi:hypothetical protein